jgi:serine/threonine protein kinase
MTAVIDPPSGPGSGLPMLGHYQLLERVGAGGLGEVYRARDTVHGRTVAIKRVPAALSADSARAAALEQATAQLETFSHPGIALLYECGIEDSEMFLALEFVAGQRLSEIIADRPLHPRRAVEIAIQVAEALSALHAAGLLHGDLRPDNIVITTKGHAKLVDSGLAAFTAGGALRASAGARLGGLPQSAAATLRYLAPEQAAGEPTDQRSDVFSLGCVLYEMLTGRGAFDRPSADAIVLAVMQATPQRPSATMANVPSELDLIATRALAKSLDRRYPTAAALADDLRVAGAVLDAALVTTEMPGASPDRSRRPSAALIVVAILLVALLLWWQRTALGALF